MLRLVEELRSKEIEAALAESPTLLEVRDAKGRNWLHVCCGLNPKGRKLPAMARIRTARVLLDRGIDIDREAFREGKWKATPLWYAVARGRCLPLARFLLERGADPEHCLWGASFHDDAAAIRLLVGYGAQIDPVQEGQTPFLGAIQWSRFRAAAALLAAGADPDFRDAKGMTGLHYLLRKGSEPHHIRLLVRHGARGDIPDASGRTAQEVLRCKRAPAFKRLATLFAKG